MEQLTTMPPTSTFCTSAVATNYKRTRAASTSRNRDEISSCTDFRFYTRLKLNSKYITHLKSLVAYSNKASNKITLQLLRHSHSVHATLLEFAPIARTFRIYNPVTTPVGNVIYFRVSTNRVSFRTNLERNGGAI